jgi:hypothetical protein
LPMMQRMSMTASLQPWMSTPAFKTHAATGVQPKFMSVHGKTTTTIMTTRTTTTTTTRPAAAMLGTRVMIWMPTATRPQWIWRLVSRTNRATGARGKTIPAPMRTTTLATSAVKQSLMRINLASLDYMKTCCT